MKFSELNHNDLYLIGFTPKNTKKLNFFKLFLSQKDEMCDHFI